LCKHLVAVLERVVSKPRRGDVERESAPEPAMLRWDPVRPLSGPGDWLARIRWVDGTPDRDLRRWLRPAHGNSWTVAVPGALQQRLALVDGLLAALHDGNGEPNLKLACDPLIHQVVACHDGDWNVGVPSRGSQPTQHFQSIGDRKVQIQDDGRRYRSFDFHEYRLRVRRSHGAFCLVERGGSGVQRFRVPNIENTLRAGGRTRAGDPRDARALDPVALV
jgi:hypothetical protein